MADVNVTLNPGSGGAALRMKPGPSGSEVPYTKLEGGAEGAVDPINGDSTNGLDVDVTRNGTPATGCGGGEKSIDPAAVSATNVASSQPARKRLEVQNISSVPMKLNFGGTASSSAYHKVLQAGAEWVSEGPHVYTGQVSAWHAAVGGKLLVVAEFT